MLFQIQKARRTHSASCVSDLDQRKAFNRFTTIADGNKDLLYSTGNSSQYSVITYMRKESEKE